MQILVTCAAAAKLPAVRFQSIPGFLVSITCLAGLLQAQEPVSKPRGPVTAAERLQGFRSSSLLAKPRASHRDTAQMAAAEARENVRLRRSFDRFDGLRVLDVQSDEKLELVIKRLRDSGRYEFVEPDYVVTARAIPNDPAFVNGEQWALRNTGQNNGISGADIGAVAAWDTRTDAGSVIVAVIDSGVRATHQELAANLWRNPGESGNGRETNGLDDDANGYIDDVYGMNAIVPAGEAGRGNPNDVDGHGTAVAGVIGAIGNNGLGVAGVAWKVQIMSLKFLGPEGGLISDEIECFDYAISKGAKLINASFGGASYSQSLGAAIRRLQAAGIIVVAAAGNDASDNDLVPDYPAGYPFDNLVAVGNSTRRDEVALSSNVGNGAVDLFAPGSDIVTTSFTTDTATTSISGTSFSAPMVTGALALLTAQFPNDTYRQLINRLFRTVDRKAPFISTSQTGGRLNLARLLTSTDNRPFNDDFASAATLQGSFITARATTTGATKEAGEANHAGVVGAASVWWSWTAPASSTARIETTGSSFDTTLAVYTGSSVNALTQVVSNNNASSSGTSSVVFACTAGVTYRIAVDGAGGASGFVSFNLSKVPENDTFAAATLVTGPSFRVDGNNRGATREAGEPSIRQLPTSHSVWYSWTAPAAGRYHLSAFNNAPSVDTMLGIYTGGAVGALTEVATNIDGQNAQLSAMVSFTATAGVTYRFLVDTEAAAGQFALTLVDADWEYLIDDPVNSPASVAQDGTIYFSGDGELVALNPDGNPKWFYVLDDVSIYTAPAVGADGTIYVGDSTGVVYAVTPAGTLKWRFSLNSVLTGSMALGADNVLYVRALDGLLYAINPDGTRKWTAPVPGESYGSPSIGADGVIYIGASNNRLYAINPDGTQKWAYDTGDGVYTSPAIGGDGTIYVGTLGNKLLAVRPDGTLRWSYTAGGSISSSPAIGLDGALYFGSYDHHLHAVNADGTARWKYDLGDEVRTSSPAIAADGSIYIGTLDGQLHAVNAGGTRRRIYYFADEIRASPLLHNGMLYIGAADARLIAINLDQTPASTPWPMFAQNVRRTGRVTTQALALSLSPASRTVASGDSVTFRVGAVGGSPLSYQWRKDGVPIAGANGVNYTLSFAQPADAGSYSVTVSDPSGSITSVAATLVVTGEASNSPGRLGSLSVRSTAGTGDRTLIVGFATTGPKNVVIRAVGPTLAALNVTGVLPDPQLTVFDQNRLALATNDDWAASLAPNFSALGLFALPNASRDAAVSLGLPSGSSTAHASGKAASTGVVLVEVYETETGPRPASAPKFKGLSARSQVGVGGDILIAGFAITGETPRKVLIRGVGPSLGQLGVDGTLADPQLALFRDATQLSTNDNWTTDAEAVDAARAASGAFPLAPGSKDAALVITLSPGTYTAQVSGVNATTGVALVEVYELP